MRAAAIREALSRPWRHGEALDLRGITLDEVLDLGGLPLSGVDLRGAHLKGGLVARGARFDGLAWFQGARIDGVTDLSGALFVMDARFDDVGFADACLTGAEFRGTASFKGARLVSADLERLVCYGNLDVSGVRCSERFTLAGSECLGGIWAQDCALPADADFSATEVHGRLWLRRARRGNAAMAVADFGTVFGYSWT